MVSNENRKRIALLRVQQEKANLYLITDLGKDWNYYSWKIDSFMLKDNP